MQSKEVNELDLELAVRCLGIPEKVDIDFKDLEILTIPAKKTINLYIENYYDLLETDIYESEGEKYLIYLFEVQKDNKFILLNRKIGRAHV